MSSLSKSLSNSPSNSPSNSLSTDRQRAIALIDALSADQLSKAIELLQDLVGQDTDATVTQELIEIINARLSIEDQARLHQLREWLYEETITDEEHQELLAFVDRIDGQEMARTKAMIQLADHRKVDFDTIVREFPAKPLP